MLCYITKVDEIQASAYSTVLSLLYLFLIKNFDSKNAPFVVSLHFSLSSNVNYPYLQSKKIVLVPRKRKMIMVLSKCYTYISNIAIVILYFLFCLLSLIFGICTYLLFLIYLYKVITLTIILIAVVVTIFRYFSPIPLRMYKSDN